MATSPFAVLYATSARMYALMMLWSVLGLLALLRALERPTVSRLAAVGALTALMLYTHYWGLYFVAAAAGWLAVGSRRWRAGVSSVSDSERRARWKVLAAVAVGAATFLPWLPAFVFQSRHTGTPWGHPTGPGDVVGLLGDYAGGGPWGIVLALSLFGLLLFGLFGRPTDEGQTVVEVRLQDRVRPVAWILAGGLVMSVLAGTIARVAFAGRYTAVLFPLFVVIAGRGASVIGDRRVLGGVSCRCVRLWFGRRCPGERDEPYTGR